jgi:hypothetical protein
VIGPAADPDLSIRTRRGLVERDELLAADDPTLPGNRDLTGRFTIVVPATPLARRIAVAAAIDPGFVGAHRCRRNDPNERDSKQGGHVWNPGACGHFA